MPERSGANGNPLSLRFKPSFFVAVLVGASVWYYPALRTGLAFWLSKMPADREGNHWDLRWDLGVRDCNGPSGRLIRDSKAARIDVKFLRLEISAIQGDRASDCLVER